jgi:hypothetical protein
LLTVIGVNDQCYAPFNAIFDRDLFALQLAVIELRFTAGARFRCFGPVLDVSTSRELAPSLQNEGYALPSRLPFSECAFASPHLHFDSHKIGTESAQKSFLIACRKELSANTRTMVWKLTIGPLMLLLLANVARVAQGQAIGTTVWYEHVYIQDE